MSVQMQTQISHACDNDCTSSVLMLGLEWSDCPFCLKYFISLLLKIYQVRLGPARQEGGGVRTEAAAQGPLPDQRRASGWPRRAKWSGLGEADLHHQGRGHRPSPVASKPRLSRYLFITHKLILSILTDWWCVAVVKQRKRLSHGIEAVGSVIKIAAIGLEHSCLVLSRR